MKKEKPKYNVFQNIVYMIHRSRMQKWSKYILLSCIILIVLNVCESIMQLFIAPKILEKLELSVPISELLATIAFYSIGLFLLKVSSIYIDGIFVSRRNNVRFLVRNAIVHKACTTAYPNVTDPHTSKMQEAAFSNTDHAGVALTHIWSTLMDLCTGVFSSVIYLSMISNLNINLAGIVVLTAAIGFFVTKHLKQWGYTHREERASYLRRFQYISDKMESVTLAKDIRIFGIQAWLKDVQNSAIRAYDAFVTRRETIYRIASIVDAMLTLARNGIAYVYLIHTALTQRLPASVFLLYFTAISAFAERINGILSCVTTLYSESLEISTVREYLDTPEPFRFDGGVPIPQAAAYELRLEDVTFRYPGSNKNLFQNLNLTIRAGEKLAIVGLNGAGKTTLVKLLCGFYDPNKGRVLLNGQDIREFNRQDYYKLFSAVFQEYSLLDVTLRENVAHRAVEIDDNRVTDSLIKAGLKNMVSNLPAGLDSHIGRDVFPDGVLLSGGQTQRLILARALYKNSPILVLDEPTAALDPIAEDDIYRKYNEMAVGKTSVFISHRLASTRFCDRIILLNDGIIAEEGTHEQLLKYNGLYAELFEVQSRYYQEGRDFHNEAV